MKIVILAGGFGTRFSEETHKIPKPMIKICGKPIIVHIMNHYFKNGFKDFIIATGYKQEVIKRYFKKKFKYAIFAKSKIYNENYQNVVNELVTKLKLI